MHEVGYPRGGGWFTIDCTGYPKQENCEKKSKNGEIQNISLNGVATSPHSI